MTSHRTLCKEHHRKREVEERHLERVREETFRYQDEIRAQSRHDKRHPYPEPAYVCRAREELAQARAEVEKFAKIIANLKMQEAHTKRQLAMLRTDMASGPGRMPAANVALQNEYNEDIVHIHDAMEDVREAKKTAREQVELKAEALRQALDQGECVRQYWIQRKKEEAYREARQIALWEVPAQPQFIQTLAREEERLVGAYRQSLGQPRTTDPVVHLNDIWGL